MAMGNLKNVRKYPDFKGISVFADLFSIKLWNSTTFFVHCKFYISNSTTLKCVSRLFLNECLKYVWDLHIVVLLMHILQILLELLQLNEAVLGQLLVLLHFTVHFLKLKRERRWRKHCIKNKVWKETYKIKNLQESLYRQILQLLKLF